jgi:predicted transcriptional regulator
MVHMADDTSTHVLELTAQIVVGYLSNNALPPRDIAQLIEDTHSAMTQIASAPSELRSAVPLEPAVPIRKSVTKDAIICLECGKPYRSLKRHLRAEYGLSAEQYREKWGLPADYPMVPASYSAKRSSLALKHGLGRKP